MFAWRYGFTYGLIQFTPSCIESIIPGHLEMLFRDVLDQELYKIQYRKRFLYIGVIFVPVIMKSHILSIIGINPGRGDSGTPKIPADIFYYRIRITKVRLGIDIKPFFILRVDS